MYISHDHYLENSSAKEDASPGPSLRAFFARVEANSGDKLSGE